MNLVLPILRRLLAAIWFSKRRAHFSSLILTGQMTRAALERVSKPELSDDF
jgi:hypothetical protein